MNRRHFGRMLFAGLVAAVAAPDLMGIRAAEATPPPKQPEQAPVPSSAPEIKIPPMEMVSFPTYALPITPKPTIGSICPQCGSGEMVRTGLHLLCLCCRSEYELCAELLEGDSLLKQRVRSEQKAAIRSHRAMNGEEAETFRCQVANSTSTVLWCVGCIRESDCAALTHRWINESGWTLEKMFGYCNAKMGI